MLCDEYVVVTAFHACFYIYVYAARKHSGPICPQRLCQRRIRLYVHLSRLQLTASIRRRTRFCVAALNLRVGCTAFGYCDHGVRKKDWCCRAQVAPARSPCLAYVPCVPCVRQRQSFECAYTLCLLTFATPLSDMNLMINRLARAQRRHSLCQVMSLAAVSTLILIAWRAIVWVCYLCILCSVLQALICHTWKCLPAVAAPVCMVQTCTMRPLR